MVDGPVRVAIDAHVVGRRQTGNERYVVGLVEALVGRGDVEPLVYLDERVAWPGATTPTSRTLGSRRRWVRLTVDLPRMAKRDGVDLLQIQYVRPPVVTVPVAAVVHDISFEDIPWGFPSAMRLRLAVMVRHSVRSAKVILTGSEFTRTRLVERMGARPERVVVTPYGIDGRWRTPPTELELEAARAIIPDGPFVAAIGNVHPRKNIARLVRAVAIARRSGAHDLRLLLVGQRSWQAGEVDEAIRIVGAASWTTWTGYVTDATLVAIYHLATVVAYPSRYEGFGFPVGEAMAAGAVVVAAETTSIPEVAGEGALLVDPESDEAIADALVRAVDDAALRDRLRKAAITRVAELTWERTAEATVAAYRQALAGP